MKEKHCNGYSTKGYWKGHSCGNFAKHKAKDGKYYCSVHFGMITANPKVFDKFKKKK